MCKQVRLTQKVLNVVVFMLLVLNTNTRHGFLLQALYIATGIFVDMC